VGSTLIYLVGSLRNPSIPEIAKVLRANGHDVFDDWYAAGPEADDIWQRYEIQRGRSYVEALRAPHAQEVFHFDKTHLDRADVGVMAMPAGKSGHLELGYLIGQRKPGFILMDKEPERWDVMLAFATAVVYSLNDLLKELGKL
jgi:hypothetical protein